MKLTNENHGIFAAVTILVVVIISVISYYISIDLQTPEGYWGEKLEIKNWHYFILILSIWLRN